MELAKKLSHSLEYSFLLPAILCTLGSCTVAIEAQSSLPTFARSEPPPPLFPLFPLFVYLAIHYLRSSLKCNGRLL
ncbi:hypothetical protein T492DRAFT_935089 [Pavlovales sp. CCMP2436]|nr:hypothetical protein T492DRAFT_935089 [Pavlovales sp. CCMP2436]